jgi:long-chain acyl-CoA synthetase
MRTISEALSDLFTPTKLNPQWAEAIAVEGSDGHTVTYSGLESNIALFARNLKRIGIKQQDKVIISSPNSPEYAALLFAIWKIGAIAVPVDFRMTIEEGVNVTNQVKATAFIGYSPICQAMTQAKSKCTNPQLQILDFASLAKVEESKSNGEGDFQELPSNTNIPCLIILTSGTTGVPKGAVHDLASLLTNIVEVGNFAQVEPGTTLLMPLPLSHIFGLAVCLTGLLSGASVKFTLTAEDFLKTLHTRTFDIVAGVPALYNAILALPQCGIDFSKSKILLSGGAALPNSLAEQFRSRFGKRINNGYGSTEIKIIALNLAGPEPSVGKLISPAKAIILDANHEHMPEGEIGEICIEGPTLMQGYLNLPEETETVLHQGHYHTGDLGYLKDGYLFISGRDKELINVAGNKVFPCEVEDVLRQHENVKEVAVLGVPHYRLGQLVKAIVVIKDAKLSDCLRDSEEKKKEARQQLLSSFKEYCKEHLKKELRPLEWEFRPTGEALPKTNTGKVDKKKLQAVATRA